MTNPEQIRKGLGSFFISIKSCPIMKYIRGGHYMVMEVEVKDLINEIKEIEDRMESMLLNKDSTTIESLKVLYQKEIDRMSAKLIRRRAVLRIISKD